MNLMGSPCAVAINTHTHTHLGGGGQSRYARLPHQVPREKLRQSGRAWFSKAEVTFVHLSASLVENITEATHECVLSAVTQLILKVCT